MVTANVFGVVGPVVAQDARPYKEITLSANQTISGTRTFDETTSVVVAAGARFIKGPNGKLVFKGQFKCPREIVFQGFAPGDVTLESERSTTGDAVAPEWWGAAGSNDPASAAVNVAAINAALAAVARPGLPVTLKGVYYINDKIRPRSGSRLTAEGSGAIKAVPNISLPPGDYMVEIKGQSDVTIDGIEVDGNRANQTPDAAHAYGGVIAIHSRRCTIINCAVHDCNGPLTGGAVGNGVRTYIASDITIANNQIHGNNGCGVNLYNRSHKIRVIDNVIRNNREIGVESEGRGANYKDFRNSEITISGNDIGGAAEPDRLDDHGILVDWTDRSTVSGNRCRNTRHNGIEILGCHDITVAKKQCEKNGDVGPPYTWAGIRVTAEGFGDDGRSSNVAIRDNTVTGSQFGIYLDNVDHVTIHANTITGTSHGALIVGRGAVDVEVSDNLLEAAK